MSMKEIMFRDLMRGFSMSVFAVKLRRLSQPQMRARTYTQTNPSAQRATQLGSVLARV
jgi:hypothetical protein